MWSLIYRIIAFEFFLCWLNIMGWFQVILDEAIVKLTPDFFWLGGGEVDLKLGIRASELIRFINPFIVSCSSNWFCWLGIGVRINQGYMDSCHFQLSIFVFIRFELLSTEEAMFIFIANFVRWWRYLSFMRFKSSQHHGFMFYFIFGEN